MSMTTKINLVDLFADLEIDAADYQFITDQCSTQESYEKILKNNPNAIVLKAALDWASELDNSQDNRSYKAWTNMLKVLLVEFCRDPYWNSRLGWMMWFWVCYARYDSYYPMAWCFHYDPMNWYRMGEPHRPPELERRLPDDPFNIKGECFVHPEWYKMRKEDEERAKQVQELQQQAQLIEDTGNDTREVQE